MTDSDAMREVDCALTDDRVTKEIDVLQIMPAERAILQLLADGKPISEIAARLRVAQCQVEEQLTTLCGKLGATSRTEAIAAAFKRGLVVVQTTLGGVARQLPSDCAKVGGAAGDACGSSVILVREMRGPAIGFSGFTSLAKPS